MTVAALVLLLVGGVSFLVRAVRGPSLADRIVALDALVVTVVSAVLVHAVHEDTTRFLDVALVAGFIGFLGTTAAARYVERRGG